MKEITLTQGKVAIVDDADYEAVSQFKWYAHKRRGIFYAARNVRKSDGTRETQSLHEFLMPGFIMVDHKDGDSLNDQRYNLRPCSCSQNQGNSRKRAGTSSNYKGVFWRCQNKKWTAYITFQRHRHVLGCFLSEEDAARAYDEAAKKYHGEFARLNFPINNL